MSNGRVVSILEVRPNTRCPTALLGLGTGHPIGPVVYLLISGSLEGGYWVSDEGTGGAELGRCMWVF